MGIKIEDLLAAVDPYSESKVETACTKLKAVIQNALRSESRLFKRQRDANGKQKMGENADVQVLVKSGVPEHLRGWALPNLEPLAALIAADRPTIERTRQGLVRISALLQRVASLPGARELIGGGGAHIPPVRQLLDELLRSVSGIRLTQAILGAGGDALGRYIYRDLRPNRPRTERVPRIELYWQMIGFVANQLDATVQDLTIVVLSHEQSHAYTHLGYDANGCAWELESFHRSELGLVEGLAQYYTARIVGSTHVLSLTVLSRPSREARRIGLDFQGSRITPPTPPSQGGDLMVPPSQGRERERSLATSFHRAQQKHASRNRPSNSVKTNCAACQ